MKLPELSIRRPVFISMIFVGILVLGMMSLKFLPVDLMPDITLPTVGIVTLYPGASPKDVETLVTKPIEDYVSTVPDLKEVTSRSLENISVVSMRFAWGTNMDEAANEIRSRIDMAKRLLPEDIENPVIFKFDMSMWPILFYGIEADQSYPRLREIIDDKVVNPLKRIPGVAIISVFGGLYREIRVSIDKARLEGYGIPVQQVVQAIQAANLSVPAGNLKTGKMDFTIRIPSEIENPEDLNNIVVGYMRGIPPYFSTVPVYLKDIAKVEDTFKEEESVVTINGKPGVLMMIQKQSGSNTLEVVDRVKRELKQLEKTLPPDVHFYLSQDSSDFIRQSINNLTETVIIGGILVILVIFLFLRQIAGSIIVGVTIPFSLIIAFIFMYLMGYTINMMSLTALAIAVGMVVDDAIVIYENVYRHREKGIPAVEAALYGSSEVGLAVTASTLTIVAVFLPIIYVQGIAGIMFKQLGFVICVVILASLFASLTLTPMMSSMMLKNIEGSNRGIFLELYNISEKAFIQVEKLYDKTLGWALANKKKTILAGIVVFIISLMLLPLLGVEFFPEQDQGQVNGSVELPLGTRVEETEKIMHKLNEIVLRDIPEAKVFFARAGRTETGWATLIGRREDSNILMFGATLVKKKERKRSNRDIAYFLSQNISRIPGVKLADFYTADPMQSAALGGAKPLAYEIYGDELDTIYSVAKDIQKVLKNHPNASDVTISMEEGKPELNIIIDRDKASSFGITPGQIIDTMRTYFAGKVASKFREYGKEYDIVVKLDKKDRIRIDDIENAIIATPAGQIPLKSVAEIRKEVGPIEIGRKNQSRMIKVEAGVYGKSLGEVADDIKKELKKLRTPEGVFISESGALKEQEESFGKLWIAFLLSIVLVYIVMAAEFESLKNPFIIMFSVPFAITGVVWGLLITGKPFSLITFVGIISLVGIVVKNAIVLIDYTNILRERGLALVDAIRTAGVTRLRPVLMTAFTTVFGMLPLVLSRAEGSEVWSMLGLTVISGLLVSTFITLVFVPCLYLIVNRGGDK